MVGVTAVSLLTVTALHLSPFYGLEHGGGNSVVLLLGASSFLFIMIWTFLWLLTEDPR